MNKIKNNVFVNISSKAYVAGIAGVFLGTYIGTKVFERIPAQVFRYVVYAYIGICGMLDRLPAGELRRDLVERGLRDVDVAALDQREHLPEEERVCRPEGMYSCLGRSASGG